MKVITGICRGRNLETLCGDKITRPTTQSTKEAIFSSIQFELEGKRVLDLFAGCGQLGIEALSRGAAHCTFVENNRSAYKIVCSNIEKCSLKSACVVEFTDAELFLKRKNTFDIAFLDPPYKKDLVKKCLPLLLSHMADDGVIICETAYEEALNEDIDGWKITKQKKYSKTKVTYYRKERVV